MKHVIRLLLIAFFALSIAACDKQASAPAAADQAPLVAPTNEDPGAWRDYVSGVVKRNMQGVSSAPFVYLLPAESTQDFQGSYDRLLEKAKSDVDRGILPGNLERLKSVVEKPYGLFFVCGPTGSGKTTTLHSVLKYLNTPDTKIWTAEDPVEITQKGLRQVQINRKAGLDFATIMRAFLRADPDIIMVGEMRDKETVSIGIEASLTGHLVFATLHTNSAPESIIRLLDMGMDPFNFADALLGVLAQRLAKRLCAKCKEAYTPGTDEIRAMLTEFCQELLSTTAFRTDPKAGLEAVYADWTKKYTNDKGQFVLYRKAGCEACSGTGYKGRVGLHELLVASDSVKKLIQEKARVAEVLAVALEEGMRTLKMDGVEKVLQGITDLAQVRAVCIK